MIAIAAIGAPARCNKLEVRFTAGVPARAPRTADPHDPATLVPMDRDTLLGDLSASEGRVVLVSCERSVGP